MNATNPVLREFAHELAKQVSLNGRVEDGVATVGAVLSGLEPGEFLLTLCALSRVDYIRPCSAGICRGTGLNGAPDYDKIDKALADTCEQLQAKPLREEHRHNPFVM